MRRISLLLSSLLVVLLPPHAGFGQGREVFEDLPYTTADGPGDNRTDRCKLDLYLPLRREDFPSLVWFHGGGLTAGGKGDETTRNIARTFADAGIAVAVANYRLSPGATFPAYVEDAAAAAAWVRGHIAEFGGDPEKIFVGGHSAGAYLASMIGMDIRYLQNAGLDAASIAGLIPVSGQMVTHFTVKKERGIGEHTIVADEAAPIHFTRKDTPPFLIVSGDRDWPARLEENEYFAAAQRAAGNDRVAVLVVKDRDHDSIVSRIPEANDPTANAIVDFIRNISEGGGE